MLHKLLVGSISMENEIFNEIITKGKKGHCILFLGAMASAPSPAGSPYQYGKKQAPPSGKELSRKLAIKCGYPDEDKDNLPRVAMYHEFRKTGSRAKLVQDIRELIVRPEIVPSPALHMLAALPFRIMITTNYDRLFDTALNRANTLAGQPKTPNVQVYDPNGTPEWVSLDPEEQSPFLLKLHGDINAPHSMVVTEEDYIKFIHRMSLIDQHPIHENIRARMRSWPILFIGYSLKDYNLRLLLRALAWNMDKSRAETSYAVDPSPDNIIVAVLNRTDESQKVTFIKKNLWDVIPKLFKACTGGEYHGQ
jgi:hypothetical protein